MRVYIAHHNSSNLGRNPEEISGKIKVLRMKRGPQVFYLYTLIHPRNPELKDRVFIYKDKPVEIPRGLYRPLLTMLSVCHMGSKVFPVKILYKDGHLHRMVVVGRYSCCLLVTMGSPSKIWERLKMNPIQAIFDYDSL